MASSVVAARAGDGQQAQKLHDGHEDALSQSHGRGGEHFLCAPHLLAGLEIAVGFQGRERALGSVKLHRQGNEGEEHRQRKQGDAGVEQRIQEKIRPTRNSGQERLEPMLTTGTAAVRSINGA